MLMPLLAEGDDLHLGVVFFGEGGGAGRAVLVETDPQVPPEDLVRLLHLPLVQVVLVVQQIAERILGILGRAVQKVGSSRKISYGCGWRKNTTSFLSKCLTERFAEKNQMYFSK